MHLLPAEVLGNTQIAPRYFVMKLHAPKLAEATRPGQFVQIRCNDSLVHPLLPRPFSVMTASANDGTIELLYRVEGVGTKLLAQARAGERLPLWGPLGNGFDAPWAATNIVVGGGVGIPPLRLLFETQMAAAVWSVTDTRVLLGARTANEVLCANEFQAHGLGLCVATDDGSWGHHGVITQVLEFELFNALAMSGPEQVRVYACGPHAMLHAVAQQCLAVGVPCQVCMEAPMPCGLGVCMGCVIPTRSHSGPPFPGGEGGQGVGYRRCCREGPVFDAREVVWE